MTFNSDFNQIIVFSNLELCKNYVSQKNRKFIIYRVSQWFCGFLWRHRKTTNHLFFFLTSICIREPQITQNMSNKCVPIFFWSKSYLHTLLLLSYGTWGEFVFFICGSPGQIIVIKSSLVWRHTFYWHMIKKSVILTLPKWVRQREVWTQQFLGKKL